MKNLIFCLFLTVSPFYFSTAQQAGDYGTAGNGNNWSVSSSWVIWSGGSWSGTTEFLPSSTKNVYIRNGHTMKVDVSAY